MLEGQEQMIEQSSMECYVISTNCAWLDMPKEYGQSQLYTEDSKICKKRKMCEMILKNAIRSAYRQNKFRMKKITVDSTAILGKKRDGKIDYDKHKKIADMKIHVIDSSKALTQISCDQPINNHDSTKFIETMEYVSDFMTYDSFKQIKHCFGDKRYISGIIQHA